MKVNRIVKKVKGRSSKVVFSRVGDVDELILFGIGYSFYKSDKKAIGGEFVFLGNKNSNKAVPLYWKTKLLTSKTDSFQTTL